MCVCAWCMCLCNLLIWNVSWVNRTNIYRNACDASAVKRNCGLINSHYLRLPDKWNDLLSSCWKFNQIPANRNYPMWKMDKFGGCLQLESHWMENKGEVSSISWISEAIWNGGIFNCCHHSMPVHATLSILIWQRKQSLTFLDSDISINLSPKTLPNA